MSFTSYGCRIGIRVTGREIPESILDILPPGWKPSSVPVVDRLYSLLVGGPGPTRGTRRYNIVYRDAQRLARSFDLETVLDAFRADLHLYVAEFARNRVFVHAGVVAWQDRAIVLAGPSSAGKSTLVAALVRAGATYYSDEYAVFDAQGRVHPFRRPLRLRGGNSGQPRSYTAAELGASKGAGPAPVGLVVMTHYRRGARWRPRELSPGRAALALLANAVGVRRRPEATLRTLRNVVTTAGAIESARNEAEEVVMTILRRAERHSRFSSCRTADRSI